MKKIIVIIFLFGTSITSSLSQNKTFNFIISIDGKLVLINDARIFLNDRNDTINVGYIPGELNIPTVAYDKLLEEEEGKYILSLDYVNTTNKKNFVNREYQIPFKPVWLSYSYFILDIYNTDSKKYRKVYDPLPGKKYNYEYRYPSFAAKLIRKKSKKCW